MKQLFAYYKHLISNKKFLVPIARPLVDVHTPCMKIPVRTRSPASSEGVTASVGPTCEVCAGPTRLVGIESVADGDPANLCTYECSKCGHAQVSLAWAVKASRRAKATGSDRTWMMPGCPDMSKENGKGIFVLDDDVAFLGSLHRFLATHGFDVQTFNSADAFSAADLGQACCLVLDIDLNGDSGIELRRRLAASGNSLPVIFITGNDNERVRKDAYDSGCLAFLTKPFPARALVEAIGVAVAQRKEGLTDQS